MKFSTQISPLLNFLIPNNTILCPFVCFTVLDEFVYAGLAENLTITALDGTTGKLLGACINVTANKKEIPETLEEYIGHYKVSYFLGSSNLKIFSLEFHIAPTPH